jgi:hypothetical protein
LMRCEPLDGSLSAEESVEPIPGQAEFLSGRLRLCTRVAQSRMIPLRTVSDSIDVTARDYVDRQTCMSFRRVIEAGIPSRYCVKTVSLAGSFQWLRHLQTGAGIMRVSRNKS